MKQLLLRYLRPSTLVQGRQSSLGAQICASRATLLVVCPVHLSHNWLENVGCVVVFKEIALHGPEIPWIKEDALGLI